MGKLHDLTVVFDNHHDRYDNEGDLEKYGYESGASSFEYERNSIPSSHSNSSRETSGSHQPMLRRTSTKYKKPIQFYKPPSRRTIRYLCLALFTTLLVFILSLFRASWNSSRQLELGPVDTGQPPKPPVWENFPFLTRYFGGIRSLVPREKNVPEYPSDDGQTSASSNTSVEARTEKPFPKSSPFSPYPDYETSAYTSRFVEKHECFLDARNTIRIPEAHSYDGVPQGQPDNVIGSHEVLSLRNDICFERFGRLGPYGYGYSIKRGGTGAGMNGEREGAEDMWKEKGAPQEVDYSKVNWADAQQACLAKNEMRFVLAPEQTKNSGDSFLDIHGNTPGTPSNEPSIQKRTNTSTTTDQTLEPSAPVDAPKTLIARTAIVIRTWWDHQYSVEDIMYLRSIIAELSLLSGGEYTVHFLVHVKDDNVPIWADRKIYDRILENSLPEEFRGMGVLWSERQMSLIYGGLQESFFRELPVHGVYRGAYMALQYFSHQHPEYKYLWNWEMDVRYTGHWYHLFDKVGQWTKEQPRKGLWERNGRFYVPSVHGTWEDFKQMVRVQTEMGTDNPNNIWSGLKAGGGENPGFSQGKGDKSVWGPESPEGMLTDQDGPIPPTTMEKDKYSWGVGEEADFITFNPLFDPDGTTWFYVEDVTGYNTTQGLPPRRATIGTSSRLSRRLLQTMHRETVLARHHMFTESWPASIALHHGYKAVYAPHPVYIDRRWPTSYLAGVMNGGRNGASGGARTSVYGGREHNFKGVTWFYDDGFAPNLWRRWLGYKVDNDGGEQEEVAGEGRMCLPGMLLHPVKGVDVVVEGKNTVEDEQGGQERDGSVDPAVDWDSID
ncbi:hypothetical protein MMC21_001352 [Puttea exsequens]|nr:hypothetical protein [Puttea exsequens]